MAGIAQNAKNYHWLLRLCVFWHLMCQVSGKMTFALFYVFMPVMLRTMIFWFFFCYKSSSHPLCVLTRIYFYILIIILLSSPSFEKLTCVSQLSAIVVVIVVAIVTVAVFGWKCWCCPATETIVFIFLLQQ